ncbi:MAG TPA: ABC transporter substrate-binding protein [Bradyrhizobium sp.]|jgi:putative ABC transport system substrate-binding protein|nr:ABC transporter substrate-binding protein [Bradyrhizobium sp.]
MSGMRRREFITFLGGAAAAWPLAARAQQSPAMPVIGFLSSRSPEDSAHLIEAFRRGLSEGGFVAGQNVAIEFRWAHGQFDLLPAMASELVGRRVSVFVAVGGEPSALAAKRATSTIPIVFAIGSDPVSAGLVESFNRPNGNLTGITLQTVFMEPKRLGLLRDLVPRALLIGVLLNSSFALAASQRQEIEEAARGIGQRIVIVDASTDGELDAAFAELAKQRADALLVAASPYFDTRRDHIVLLAQRHRLPAIYQFREFAMAGGLLSYGIAITEGYRQVGIYSANILRGAKPADLPVQAISKFELLINLKTAKALDIKISDNLLSLADEVIE